MYTLVSHAHFLCCTVCLRTSEHFHACARTRMAHGLKDQVSRRFVACVSYFSISPSLSHVSLIFAVPAQSLVQWLTTGTNAKLQERIQNHLSVHAPSLHAPEWHTWILRSRGLWITVHRCAKRKRKSIMCVSKMPSLPWNITSKVHKIRTTLTRRSNLPACFGEPMPLRCG